MPFNVEVSVTRLEARERKLEQQVHLAAVDGLLIRRATAADRPALEQLATLESRELAPGPHLVAIAGGELIAAVPVYAAAAPLADPFRPTADVVRLLELQARRLRAGSTTLRAAA
jgi:hypothetical protein